VHTHPGRGFGVSDELDSSLGPLGKIVHSSGLSGLSALHLKQLVLFLYY